MTMTRQHFALIADVLKDSLQHNACGEDQRAMCDTIAHNMASALRTTNPNFNRERFLKACGVDQ